MAIMQKSVAEKNLLNYTRDYNVISGGTMSQLEELKKITTVVADTGNIREIQKYTPTDATTNPSLIFAAAQLPEYQYLVKEAIAWGKQNAPSKELQLQYTLDRLTVDFGKEILKIVPGRVSTEVDARLSYDTDKSIARAKFLISLYEKDGIDRKRILIKLASTWEGFEAARQLEKEGIHCNMTLMFSLYQAIAAAEAKATLISPFVGRIHDWYLKHDQKESFAPADDPGVHSVTEIFNYYKKFGYPTQIMGASFRNVGEILELAGSDLLTIAPKYLEILQNTNAPVPRKLNAETAKTLPLERITFDQGQFHYLFNTNQMAVEKLSEGIRLFGRDLEKLESMLKTELSKA